MLTTPSLAKAHLALSFRDSLSLRVSLAPCSPLSLVIALSRSATRSRPASRSLSARSPVPRLALALRRARSCSPLSLVTSARSLHLHLHSNKAGLLRRHHFTPHNFSFFSCVPPPARRKRENASSIHLNLSLSFSPMVHTSLLIQQFSAWRVLGLDHNRTMVSV